MCRKREIDELKGVLGEYHELTKEDAMTKKSVVDTMRKAIKAIIPDADVRRLNVTDKMCLVFDIAESDIICGFELRELCQMPFEKLYGKKMEVKGGAGYYFNPCNVATLDPWVDGDNDDVDGYDYYRLVISIDLIHGGEDK